MKNLRAEAGAVEVAEEIEQVNFGAADFADAGNPEDFRRGLGGGGFFIGRETHGRRTPGAGAKTRRRRTVGRRRGDVIFRWVRMVSGGSIRCGFQKVAFKVGGRGRAVPAVVRGTRRRPRGRTEGWGAGLSVGSERGRGVRSWVSRVRSPRAGQCTSRPGGTPSGILAGGQFAPADAAPGDGGQIVPAPAGHRRISR